MDYESSDSRSKGCWDPVTLLTPFLEKWSSATPTPDFVVDDVWCGMVGGIGFGKGATEETVGFWKNILKDVYKGDEGRKKVRMALMCLLTRDGLVLRLGDVQCPVYWLQVSLFQLENLYNGSVRVGLVGGGANTNYYPLGYGRHPFPDDGGKRTDFEVHEV